MTNREADAARSVSARPDLCLRRSPRPPATYASQIALFTASGYPDLMNRSVPDVSSAYANTAVPSTLDRSTYPPVGLAAQLSWPGSLHAVRLIRALIPITSSAQSGLRRRPWSVRSQAIGEELQRTTRRVSFPEGAVLELHCLRRAESAKLARACWSGSSGGHHSSPGTAQPGAPLDGPSHSAARLRTSIALSPFASPFWPLHAASDLMECPPARSLILRSLADTEPSDRCR
jgi:hypothetical protein